MQIYVINLAKSKDRLQNIESQMQALGLDFVRVEAIDGSALDESDLAVRQMEKNSCLPGLVCRVLNEVACNLSHAKALELIANGSDEYGVVLEDDAALSKNAAQFLRDSSWIPEDASLIKLDNGVKKMLLRHEVTLNGGYELYKVKSTNSCAVGYIISSKTARYLYPILQTTALLVDILYYSFEFGLAKQLQFLQLYPSIVCQAALSSEIQHLPYDKGPLNKTKLIYMYKRWHSKNLTSCLTLGKKYKYEMVPVDAVISKI